MKERNISIDILKFFAALLITNSHMEKLYHPYELLATGGAIGDVLFFFCSGFTLFLGRMGRFDNWYKRRINRIYPTVFAWAILAVFVFGLHYDMKYTLIHGGGWFVSCIMIYYVILYLIRWLMMKRLNLVFLMVVGLVIIWYLLIDKPMDYNMYGNTYFKWGHYFLFMLLGAMLGVSGRIWKFNWKCDSLKLFACIIVYYGILFIGRKSEIMHDLQILSLIPLLGITFYFYKVCNSEAMKKLYDNKYTGTVIRFVGGLCLEIYLVQYNLLTDKMNGIFPLNLVIMFLIIVAVAYILRCMARIFSQTFREQEYDWKAVFKAV